MHLRPGRRVWHSYYLPVDEQESIYTLWWVLAVATGAVRGFVTVGDAKQTLFIYTASDSKTKERLGETGTSMRESEKENGQ